MELLKERILRDGKVIGNDILKVDSFLNHQVDVGLLSEIGMEFKRIFSDCQISKIVTVESSGIGIACITAQYFAVPVVFAKKGHHRNISDDVYSADVFSFTKGISCRIAISKEYLNADDRVLIIDDFLANGQAVLGLKKIIEDAGATLQGVGIVIEKEFQKGGKLLRDQGIRVESLAVVKGFENGKVILE